MIFVLKKGVVMCLCRTNMDEGTIQTLFY